MMRTIRHRMALCIALLTLVVPAAHAALEDPFALALARAAMAERCGDARGVRAAFAGVTEEQIRTAAQGARAAWLLADAAHALDDDATAKHWAGVGAQAPDAAPYRAWFARLALPGAVGASRDSALATYAPRLATLERVRDTDDAVLRTLCAPTKGDALDRAIAGEAAITLAARAVAKGEDARAWLAAVPADAPAAARARLLTAALATEQHAPEAGAAVRAALEVATGATRRDLLRRMAGDALARGAWAESYAWGSAADSEWTAAQRDLDAASADDLLRDAETTTHAWTLATTRTAEAFAAASRAATELQSAAVPPPPAVDFAASSAARYEAAPLAPEAQARLDALTRMLAEVRSERIDVREQESTEAARLTALRDHLARQRRSLGTTRTQLDAQRAMLDSLVAASAAIDRALLALRDSATVRVRTRAAALLAQARAQQAWHESLRRIALGGTGGPAAAAAPEGATRVDSLLAADLLLTQELAASVAALAAGAPQRIADSYAQHWRPTLLTGVAREDARAQQTRAWAQTLDRTLAAALEAQADSPARRALAASGAALERRADSLAAVLSRERVAAAVAARRDGLAALSREREGIDYLLATSAWAASVGLAESDSSAQRLRVHAVAGAAGGADADTAGDADAAQWRARAIPALERFLAAHPQSGARAEVRFHLADLEVSAARADFRARMRAFAKHEPGAPLPVFDASAALAQYRAILTEDRDFAHRDAALFEAGMLLADRGDAAFERDLNELVTAFPNSPYVQQAWLRMGDARFDAKQFDASAECFAHVLDGPDPTLQAIAGYKLGWARYEREQFDAAAAAFANVLAMYRRPEGERPLTNLRAEAAEYLVHALAANDGVAAYARLFPRDAEPADAAPLLLQLARWQARHGAPSAAAASDAEYVVRHPLDPDALAAARERITALTQAGHTADVANAMRESAPRFAPKSDWARAQQADSVRTAGSTFAREAWQTLATDATARARNAKGDAAAWRDARAADEMLLDHFPDTDDAALWQLAASEACERSGDPDAALAHADRAIAAGPDSLARIARWQRVAITDARYERSRTAGTAGDAALAREVVREADTYLKHVADDPRAANLRWRTAQLALAHGWNDEADHRLDAFASGDSLDPRAALARSQQGELAFAAGRFEAAADAFARVAPRPGTPHADSLARHAADAVPVCLFRAAEAAVAADSTRTHEHAQRFAAVAARAPRSGLAPQALYRAAEWDARGGDRRAGAARLAALVTAYPSSPLVRDARLQRAQWLELEHANAEASAAYAEFVRALPRDGDAAAAWLRAADLADSAGEANRADSLRTRYLQAHPEDLRATAEILERGAKREIAACDAAHPLSARLATRNAGTSAVARYVQFVAKHPALGSRATFGALRFALAEESVRTHEAAALTQPLAASLATKKRLLDSLLVRERRTVDTGDPQWAHAATLRMGEALVSFADALERAERPKGLSDADRKAYDDVLRTQSAAFRERGVGVLTQLVRQARLASAEDAWLQQARTLLWQQRPERVAGMTVSRYPLPADDEGVR